MPCFINNLDEDEIIMSIKVGVKPFSNPMVLSDIFDEKKINSQI